MRIGALEAGGTKMVCAVGNEKGEWLEKTVIQTETPEQTIPKLTAFFQAGKIEALGIGSFGPVDLNQTSALYGYITTTPKKAWRNFPLVRTFQQALSVPVGFDTDVNAAVLGEVVYGKYGSDTLDTCIYITVGTGIGVGVMVEGRLLHGMLHPEAGHILLTRRQDDSYRGRCPFHTNCLEGLASGPAIEERWGEKAPLLAEKFAVWELEAHYLGQAISNYILSYAPKRIILGGGVMNQRQMLPLVRGEVVKQLNGYIRTREMEDMEQYIVPASLDGDQGIYGCLELGKAALAKEETEKR